jgi:type I restriction enzyme R subunit
VREEVFFTNGRIIWKGKTVKRGERKRADYILYYKPNIPIAVIEAKDNNHAVADGMQQALAYADKTALDLPFVFSSNGDAFLFHDRTGTFSTVEQELPLDSFPAPDLLWQHYCRWKRIKPAAELVVSQDYYTDGSGKSPRYYQLNAINRAIEAIATGRDRILLVMATGTGKTYTAFQIIWRLWKAGAKKRILFLADRNILVDQTRTNDFKPFGGAMTKIARRQIDKSYEIYLSLYQAVTGSEEDRNIYKQFSPEFFDLIIVDECHRGSARENSAWREILEYFSAATQIGLTATPKETCDVSNIHYFGDPVYTYSLRQGIDDGFLAPYKVVRIDFDKDLTGWRPPAGKRDKYGEEIEDRVYNQKDFDKTLVLDKRTELAARKITEFLKGTDRFDKTIVFCEDIDHAQRMRQALVNANADLAAENPKYVMQITGDNAEPLAAGLAIELVEGRGADGLARAVRDGKGQFVDAGVEVVDRGEHDAAGGRRDRRARLVRHDPGRHASRKPHLGQVERNGNRGADGRPVELGQPLGRQECLNTNAVDCAVGPSVGLFKGQVTPGPLVDGRGKCLIRVLALAQDSPANPDLFDRGGLERRPGG